MAINFNSALGIHPQALVLREKRGEILAANMANADTPDYKARDLDFHSLLNNSLGNTSNNSAVVLQQTLQEHMPGQNVVLGAQVLYRNPQQSSLDGNTVESHIEQAKFAENAVQYESSLSFLKGQFSNLLLAIKGQ